MADPSELVIDDDGGFPGDRRRGLAIDLRSISKRYRGAVALRDITISIASGEIHSLVGENGAGKSTLGKIIGGAVLPDEGEIKVNGSPVSFRSPRDAIREGVALIDQELALVPNLSVLDNVFLGAESGSAGLLDRADQRRRFRELAEHIGFTVNHKERAGNLRVADQQKVEVLRALVRRARLIVMDEPTASLSRPEAVRLLAVARDLRAEGVTVVFVSHFLGDVLEISDTVTVLKDGRHVKTAPAAEQTEDELVTAMLGRSLDMVFPPARLAAEGSATVLKVSALSREPAFRDVSFEVHVGEIVGMAGLVGSGRSELARCIFGADRRDSGEVIFDGKALSGSSPRAAIHRGMALLPESRKEQGLVMIRSVRDNVLMAHPHSSAVAGIIRPRTAARVSRDALKSVDVRAASPGLPVSALSGGNQQKVALAKWLVNRPRLLIADEPTRGVDVGAKRAIYDLLNDLAAQGVAILVISSELEEVLGLAHRVLVMRAGEIVAEFPRETADEERVMRAAFGRSTGVSPTPAHHNGGVA
jgi:ABC-type sugar transport system ATPase subunit